MGKIVVLGVFVADMAFRADRMPHMGETFMGNSFALGPGGKGSNQAVAAGRLGADCHMLTKLGQDDFAQLALDTWSKAGVTPHAEQVAESYTGAAHIFIEEASGDNAIIIAPGAAALIGPDDIAAKADLIRSADIFITQLEQPMDAALRALEIAREAEVTTILNPAPAADLPAGMLALCDYVTPNETEAEALTGIKVDTLEAAQKAALSLQDNGVRVPLITLGARGAYLSGHGVVPALISGEVVETTGAGDAFNAGFATALSEGASAEDAVKMGCATAGISVTRAGAAASMPSRAEVEALLAETSAN